MGTCVEQLLKDGPCGTELCWSSAGRTAACGMSTQDQFGKDGILWEGPHVEEGQMMTVKEIKHHGLTTALIPLHCLGMG